jgi:hypothetical protein
MARTRRLEYDPTFGVRLNAKDRLKLNQLCEATQFQASDVLRLLIRLAKPTDLPVIEFSANEVESAS